MLTQVPRKEILFIISKYLVEMKVKGYFALHYYGNYLSEEHIIRVQVSILE